MRAQDGRCEGAKPYARGPDESVGLERIHTMHAAGETFQAITDSTLYPH
jgi:hypothetical protein